MIQEFAEYFPIWNQMTREQQNRIAQVIDFKSIKRGTVVHDGSPDCLGMLLVRNGQLRAYLLNDEGRERRVGKREEPFGAEIAGAGITFADPPLRVVCAGHPVIVKAEQRKCLKPLCEERPVLRPIG